MSTSITLPSHHSSHLQDEHMQEFVTMVIENQLFGISVYSVQDVLAPQKITSIPLSPPEVVGSLNLRGRIVTSIDLRVRLGLPQLEDREKRKSIVVEHGGELYSLIVDTVGDVLTLGTSNLSENPHNMASHWREISLGVFTLENQILVILDVGKLLNFGNVILGATDENLPDS